MIVEAILQQVEALTAEERAELFDRIEERYGRSDLEISDELKALLDEREAAADATPGVGYSWEEVVEYVRRKQ
ncbi:MAG: addiction module protein [Gemmataceae bacterium]|nr:addiction module protein [Gemmataceae bacterium]